MYERTRRSRCRHNFAKFFARHDGFIRSRASTRSGDVNANVNWSTRERAKRMQGRATVILKLSTWPTIDNRPGIFSARIASLREIAA